MTCLVCGGSLSPVAVAMGFGKVRLPEITTKGVKIEKKCNFCGTEVKYT